MKTFFITLAALSLTLMSCKQPKAKNGYFMAESFYYSHVYCRPFGPCMGGRTLVCVRFA